MSSKGKRRLLSSLKLNACSDDLQSMAMLYGPATGIKQASRRPTGVLMEEASGVNHQRLPVIRRCGNRLPGRVHPDACSA
jgi:hypothetical protein